MAAERVEDLRIFVSAAAAGSFSAAARELGLTPAVASAAVKRLEDTLGVRLFVRSTRSLRLTAEGERYRDHAHAALAALEAGRGSVQRDRHSIAGTLSLSMPSDLGRHMLLPWLDAFQREHPRIRLQVRISDRLTDLHRQGVDIAIRYGEPEDSSMIALPLAPDNRRVLCAAPDYFARCGMPRTPEDLRQHNCLTFMLSDAPHDRWRFERDGQMSEIAVSGDRAADDGDVVRRWALAGDGLAYKSYFDVADDLRAGRLVAALPDYQGERSPVYLLCVERSRLSPAVRRLRDFLAARFAATA